MIQACLRRELPADLNDSNANVKVMNAGNSSLNTSRECKLPNKTTQPPVIVSDYNDEGECVPEGIITNRLMVSETTFLLVRQLLEAGLFSPTAFVIVE